MYQANHKQSVSNLSEDNKKHQKGDAENAAFHFSDNRPEALIQRKFQDSANNVQQTGPIAQFQSAQTGPERKSENIGSGSNAVQLRTRTEDEELGSSESATQLIVQRVVDASVPIGARIKIDREGASDFGDTGIIRRPSRVKPECMAVEFDNEPGILYRVYFNEMSVIAAEAASSGAVESAFTDPLYPRLIFALNPVKTDEMGDDVYDVTGPGLGNPASVTKEGSHTYYDCADNEQWIPRMPGEDAGLTKALRLKLNGIARAKFGVRCHEVATEMQDAFRAANLNSEVLEVYTTDEPDNGNRIVIMGGEVRNHYANVLNGIAYDSSTGGHGVPWDRYLAGLQSQNVLALKSRKAEE